MSTYANFFHKLLAEQQQPKGTTPPTGTAPPEPQAPPGTPPDAMADPAAMAPPPSAPPPGDPGAVPPSPTGEEPAADDDAGGDEEDKAPESVEDVVKDAEDRAEKTTDVLSLLKGVKADLQKGTLLKDPNHAKELVDTLKSSQNSNLVDVGDRLAKYLSVKAAKGATMDNRARIQETIRKLVKIKVNKLIKESEESVSTSVELGAMDAPAASKPVSADFDALRWIGLEAQKNALSFESTIRKELEIDPNTMDKAGQDAYSAAMEQFHMAMVAAVTDAVNAVKDLPKKSEEKEQVTETPANSPAPPAVPPSQPAAPPPPPGPQPGSQKRPAV